MLKSVYCEVITAIRLTQARRQGFAAGRTKITKGRTSFTYNNGCMQAKHEMWGHGF